MNLDRLDDVLRETAILIIKWRLGLQLRLTHWYPTAKLEEGPRNQKAGIEEKDQEGL